MKQDIYAAPGAASGFGPKRFASRVPSKHQKTISTMMPISGMKAMSHHQPLRSVSWSLRTPIASDGRNVAKLQIVDSTEVLLDKTTRSMIVAAMLTRTVNRIQY